MAKKSKNQKTLKIHDDGVDVAGEAAGKETFAEEGAVDQEAPVVPEDLQVFVPGIRHLEEGEELEVDPSAYYMLHSFTTEWPCLSFDVLRGGLGSSCLTDKYPQSATIVAGSQAQHMDENRLYVIKCREMGRTGGWTEEEEANRLEDEDEEDAEKDPVIETHAIKHTGGSNRVRCVEFGGRSFAASWSDVGKVFVFDVTSLILTEPSNSDLKPTFTVSGHATEGFALAWSEQGLLTGDCQGSILLTRTDGTSTAFKNAHTASVEDLQWLSESTFLSASVDQTVRLWDSRAAEPQMTFEGLHAADINVLSVNKTHDYLLATGGDEGAVRVWDLRMLKKTSQKYMPVANFNWHTQPITGLEWHPFDSSVLASSGSDDQLAIWDLAVERDLEQLIKDGGKEADEVMQVPPQLLFIHQGQQDMKELHWHPNHSGTIINTSADSFNIFRTISV